MDINDEYYYIIKPIGRMMAQMLNVTIEKSCLPIKEVWSAYGGNRPSWWKVRHGHRNSRLTRKYNDRRKTNGDIQEARDWIRMAGMSYDTSDMSNSFAFLWKSVYNCSPQKALLRLENIWTEVDIEQRSRSFESIVRDLLHDAGRDPQHPEYRGLAIRGRKPFALCK